MSYLIFPEVSGGLGDGTEFDQSGRPRRVKNLDYVVSGWLGDAIITSHPEFLMAPHLISAIAEFGLTGISDRGSGYVSFDECLLNEDDRESEVKNFHWVDLTGEPEVDDFWMNSQFQLQVSDKAWEVLRAFSLANATIERLNPDSE